MAYTTKYGNYVKFLRGTPAAWQSIESKDSDTLYFISEPGSEKGKLYLGSKLIADGDSATNIKDLEGVLISEGIPTNSLLVYNGVTGNWENKTLQEVFAIIVDVMIGATADSNGQSGLVPVPLAGQQDMYLQGNGTWSNPTEDVEKELDNLTDTVAKNAQAWKDELALLRGGKTGTIVDIATDIVNGAVARIVSDAPESFDTLKEIADWINEHDSAINIADIVVKVNKHEEALYDAADGTPGLITKVGNLDDAINNSSTGLTVKMNTLTGSLNKAIADIADLDQGLNNLGIDVETLKALLKWQDMVEEETV